MNPAILPDGFAHEEYMHICYAMIDVCDCVWLMEGYQRSKGAMMERTYAIGKNKLLIDAISQAFERYFSGKHQNGNVTATTSVTNTTVFNISCGCELLKGLVTQMNVDQADKLRKMMVEAAERGKA